MAKETISVEVSKEAHELMSGFIEVVKASRKALADGFQPGQDVPEILIKAVGQLPAMVGGLDQLPAEAKEDLAAFVNAGALGGGQLVLAALGK